MILPPSTAPPSDCTPLRWIPIECPLTSGGCQGGLGRAGSEPPTPDQRTGWRMWRMTLWFGPGGVLQDSRYSLSRVFLNGFSELWKCALPSCDNFCLGMTKPGFSHPGETFQVSMTTLWRVAVQFASPSIWHTATCLNQQLKAWTQLLT